MAARAGPYLEGGKKQEASPEDGKPGAAEAPSKAAAAARTAVRSWPPCQLYSFVKGLHIEYRGFIPLLGLTWGVATGFTIPMSALATRVYFADILRLDGATATRFATVRILPWTLRPVFGMLSDSLPLCGFHRSSYIVVACIVGLVAWTCLVFAPPVTAAVLPFLFMGSLAISVPDVMVDATAAELSKGAASGAADLQSFAKGCMALGNLLACGLAGLVVCRAGPRAGFLASCLGPLCALVPALLGCLPEKRVPRGQRGLDTSWLRQNASLASLALLVSAVSIALTTLQILVPGPIARAAVAVACGGILAERVYTTLSRIRRVLGKAALFMLLKASLDMTYGDTMFQWMLHGQGGPHFSPVVISIADGIGAVGLFAGVILFNKYLTSVSYRRTLLLVTVASLGSSLMPLILVKRWNKGFVPDLALAIGEDAYAHCMQRLMAMPLMVLAMKVCPAGMEATLFSLLGALLAFGVCLGSLIGNGALELLGVVGGNYERLASAQALKGLVGLSTALLIPLLIPDLAPVDPVLEEDGGAAEGTTDAETGRRCLPPTTSSGESTPRSLGGLEESNCIVATQAALSSPKGDGAIVGSLNQRCVEVLEGPTQQRCKPHV